MTGDLRVGSRLPSLRALASLFGVSLPTMHAAVQILVALGFVNVHHGNGTFVARPRDEAALLNHAWLRATAVELVAMRGLLDERLAFAAAVVVARATPNRIPATLDAIHLRAHDRAAQRHAYPEQFLQADAAFHHAIGASLRCYEIAAGIRARIEERLRPRFMAVADVLAAAEPLHEWHINLAAAVLDARPMVARRLARQIADREAAALGDTLG